MGIREMRPNPQADEALMYLNPEELLFGECACRIE